MEPDSRGKMQAAVEAAVDREVAALGILPPLTPDRTAVAGRLVEQPAPPEYVLEGLLVRGVVGAVVAAGGKGKSFFLLQLAHALASGGGLGPIRAAKPTPTLVLAGEDPEEVINRRLWNIGKGDFPEGLHVASVAGLVGPLMYLDGNRPMRSEWFDWLRGTISQHTGIEVVILDPKSRFYGLDENSNDHATQWVACLEALVREFGVTVLFSHHVSKSRAEGLNQAMSRGPLR